MILLLRPGILRTDNDNLIKELVSRPIETPVDDVSSAPVSSCGYEVINGNSYSAALQTLRAQYASAPEKYPHHPTIIVDDQIFPRPLTMLKNLEMRLAHPELLDVYLDSCTGIAYRANSRMSRLIPICSDLCALPKDFKDSFLPTPYASLQGTELDLSRSVYGQLLGFDAVLNHPFWLAVSNNDVPKLTRYRDLVFNTIFSDKATSSKAMGVFVRTNVTQDELRALFVKDLTLNSDLDGNSSLVNSACFLLLTPSSSQKSLEEK
ncbi:hypothetical protein J4467_03640 [Candidatus Woesearchaeota archaeon]|nr:hypothetical protein [Candidatus Woesearchaeota archaeon]